MIFFLDETMSRYFEGIDLNNILPEGSKRQRKQTSFYNMKNSDEISDNACGWVIIVKTQINPEEFVYKVGYTEDIDKRKRSEAFRHGTIIYQRRCLDCVKARNQIIQFFGVYDAHTYIHANLQEIIDIADIVINEFDML